MMKNLDDFRKIADKTQKKTAGQFEKDIAKIRNLIAKEIEPISKKKPKHTNQSQEHELEL